MNSIVDFIRHNDFLIDVVVLKLIFQSLAVLMGALSYRGVCQIKLRPISQFFGSVMISTVISYSVVELFQIKGIFFMIPAYFIGLASDTIATMVTSSNNQKGFVKNLFALVVHKLSDTTKELADSVDHFNLESEKKVENNKEVTHEENEKNGDVSSMSEPDKKIERGRRTHRH